MRAMILAAGRGERMRPLTDVAPKPLLRAGGKSLIQHHVEALTAAGVRQIVINLAWKGKMIRDALSDGARFDATITYSDEGDEALDTGGGVFNALPLLGDDPFLLVSGDIWTDYDFARCADRLAAQDVAHFVLAPNPPFHERGDFGLQDGRVTATNDVRFTYANIGVFRPAFFSRCSPGKFPLAPLMHQWIGAGRVSGELHLSRWRNIGTPAQLAELDRELNVGPSR